MLKPIAKNLYFAIAEGRRLPDSAFPTFWNCVGYVVIGWILCWIALIVVALLMDVTK